jgi:membrane-associated phospholipid phosphatase
MRPLDALAFRLPGGLAGLAVLAWASASGAQAAPGEWRAKSYYAVNGAVTAALITGNALTRLVREQLEVGGDTVWFPGDAGLRGRCSPEAAQLSDVSLALTVAVPPAMELGGGLDARFVNAQVVYTQALFATNLLTSLTKVIFRRPRPFSYQKDAECAFQVEDPDANLSFFSGHASGSFAAAFAGSFLMSERADIETRAAIWGSELALAGATASLRARAGKHYYSDIIVGALVGAGIGLAVPALHGAAEPPRGSDLLAGAVGLAVGIAGSQLVALGAEAVDPGAVSSIELRPLFAAGGHGLLAQASW